MRPPANIVKAWINEKNSFLVRGLVMLHQPGKGWYCNIDILRIAREQIGTLPPEEAAFEIALSAVFRYITSQVYTGECVPITNTRGKELSVPKIAFEMAPFLVDRIKKLITDGGGGMNVAQIAGSQKFLARATTGDPRNAQAYGLPVFVSGRERVQHRLQYEAKLTVTQMKAMVLRRKLLARYWLRRKSPSFLTRGLVFSSDQHGFWAFNVPSGPDVVEQSSKNRDELQRLALEVSMQAAQQFVAAVNIERDGQRLLWLDRVGQYDTQHTPPEVVGEAARRISIKLLALMDKHQHGVLSHKVIETSLAMAWDPDDSKSLDDYPFPMAPTTDFSLADKQAMDKISEAFARNRRRKVDPDAQPDEAEVLPAGSAGESSWREELEIDDWVPLDEPMEDDETLDRKALEKADHDQSAALRRIRGQAGGRILPDDSASPVKHKVDYAGLPKDED